MRRALLLIYMILLAGILFGCASAAPAKKKETQPPQTKMTPDDFVNLYVDLSIVAEKFLEDSVRLRKRRIAYLNFTMSPGKGLKSSGK